MPARATHPEPEVRVLPTAAAATEVVLGELRAVAAGPARALVSFATGATFRLLLQRLHEEVQAGRLRLDHLAGTHLDEYAGMRPDQPGGMVHELCSICPSLAALLRAGAFVPVPADGGAAGLCAHEARLRHLGGVALQLLGIGRNGHIGFNEPGTPFDSGVHVAELAATTREDARARFQPAPVPTHGVTCGIATILQSRRLVLCAFGAKKAPAVRAMLRGEVGPACPASAIRRHANALVLLDEAAAGLLGERTASG
jgi:glucosamine-6-phosphate deaminase